MKARATIELSEMRDVCIVRIGTGLYEGCLLHDVCARRSHIDWHDLPYEWKAKGWYKKHNIPDLRAYHIDQFLHICQLLIVILG